MLDLVLADDHPIVCDGVRLLLESVPGWHVVAMAHTSDDAIHLLTAAPADVALVDMGLPPAGGLEVIRAVTESSARVRCVVLSMHAEPGIVRKAFQLGARAYVLKSDPASVIIEAVRQAMSGRTYLSPALDPAILVTPASPAEPTIDPLAVLSAREREILALVGGGMSSPEIGEKLFISTRTVDAHRRNILKKLGVRRAADLVHIAISNHLVVPGISAHRQS